MIPKFKYSIKGWHREIYNWVYVPEFEIKHFSNSKLYSMVYAKNIKFKSKFIQVDDNKMECPIIFVSKNPPPQNKKFLEKLIIIFSN